MYQKTISTTASWMKRYVRRACRNFMRASVSLLLIFPASAQTATTADKTVTTSAPVIPAGTTLCNTRIFGGTCKTTVAIPLPALTAKIPGQTAPVSLSGFNGSFTCAIGPNSTVAINPDGTKTITGVTCSVVTK